MCLPEAVPGAKCVFKAEYLCCLENPGVSSIELKIYRTSLTSCVEYIVSLIDTNNCHKKSLGRDSLYNQISTVITVDQKL